MKLDKNVVTCSIIHRYSERRSGRWSSPQNIPNYTVTGVNTLRPRQNGRHFADDIFKYIFLNENVWIAIKISLKFFPKVLINNITSLVQIMAWRRPGDKPLSEPMMIHLRTNIYVSRPQWTPLLSINDGCSARSRYQGQGQVITPSR